MNIPVRVPFEVFVVKATVGFEAVLQQTPVARSPDPPFDVTLPPLEAVVWVRLLIAVVVKIGIVAATVVKLS